MIHRPMNCRNCGTEIADKAIVCYRCGTATTDPVRQARPDPLPPALALAARLVHPRSLLALLLVLSIALRTASLPLFGILIDFPIHA